MARRTTEHPIAADATLGVRQIAPLVGDISFNRVHQILSEIFLKFAIALMEHHGLDTTDRAQVWRLTMDPRFRREIVGLLPEAFEGLRPDGRTGSADAGLEVLRQERERQGS